MAKIKSEIQKTLLLVIFDFNLISAYQRTTNHKSLILFYGLSNPETKKIFIRQGKTDE